MPFVRIVQSNRITRRCAPEGPSQDTALAVARSAETLAPGPLAEEVLRGPSAVPVRERAFQDDGPFEGCAGQTTPCPCQLRTARPGLTRARLSQCRNAEVLVIISPAQQPTHLTALTIVILVAVIPLG